MTEHPEITYSNTVCGPSIMDTNYAQSWWVDSLIERLLSSRNPYLTNLPEWDDYISENVGDGTEYLDVKNGLHFKVEFDQNVSSGAVGFWMQFDISHILKQREDFSELLSLVDRDDFPLKQEYEAVRSYYEQMTTRRPSSDEDFFSQFS